MNRLRSIRALRLRWVAVCSALLVLVAPQAARACAVCFGDPNSDMAKSAVRGVAFMIGVTVFMLLSIASIAGVWIVRANRLQRDIDLDLDTDVPE
ncbi:MAG TPA: hypothetical protein P5572_05425 [Phycisphaerae bacterium]|nr:hypothetical protein [Phycisphaerales bacterium]HRX84443.1 hypothetical protein [Phycisphaerae bacterium]